MDDFKKFFEELPSLTQKVRMANESISLNCLTDAEKQLAFMRLVLLRDASISLIDKLQADLNKHAGVCRVAQPYATTVIYSNMDTVKAMLDAVIGDFINTSEEDSDDSSAYEGNNEK